jgi:hypothetical protein
MLPVPLVCSKVPMAVQSSFPLFIVGGFSFAASNLSVADFGSGFCVTCGFNSSSEVVDQR